MNLVRFNPIAPRNSFFEDLFDEFFNTDMTSPAKSWAKFTDPLVNIIEEKDLYRIEMAVPGLNKEDVQINLEKDQLEISATLEQSSDQSEKNFTRKEFYYGNFKRSFHIPDSVDKNSIDASFNNGVLYIDLKKKEEAIEKGPQHIEIK